MKVNSREPMAEERVYYDRGVWLVLRALVHAQAHLDRISGAASVCDGHSTPRYGSPTMSRRPSVLDAQRGGNEYLAANLFAVPSTEWTSADVHVIFAASTPHGSAGDGVLGFTTSSNDLGPAEQPTAPVRRARLPGHLG